MLGSIGLVIVLGYIGGRIFNYFKLPSLVGMIIVGIIISPYCLNLIDLKLIGISTQLRQIALVVILTRAGLSLNLSNLKKIGRPAILLSFYMPVLK
ncbi:MAG: cation:proton antiporter [Erysipelotrichaceae bacterium]|nr:cation:proton antiporter [Erysipelotrichaceae bacterium]